MRRTEKRHLLLGTVWTLCNYSASILLEWSDTQQEGVGFLIHPGTCYWVLQIVVFTSKNNNMYGCWTMYECLLKYAALQINLLWCHTNSWDFQTSLAQQTIIFFSRTLKLNHLEGGWTFCFLEIYKFFWGGIMNYSSLINDPEITRVLNVVDHVLIVLVDHWKWWYINSVEHFWLI